MVGLGRGGAARQRQRLRQPVAPHHQQHGNERQQQRHNGAGQRAQAERTGLDIRHRRDQPQRRACNRARQRFRTFGQARVALGDQIECSLAQAEEAGGRRADLVERRRQPQQRLADIDDGRPQAAQLHRRGQAQAVAAAVADHAQAWPGLGQRRFQQRQAGIPEGGRIGIGVGQIGRQHLDLLDSGPALANGQRRRSGVAGLQRLLHAIVLQLLLQLLQLARSSLLQALHGLVTRLFQRLPVGLLPPLLHRAPSEPAGQQDQQHPQ